MINFKKLFHNKFQNTSLFSYQSLKSQIVKLCFNMLSYLKFYLLKSYILASIFVYENPVKVGFVIWLTIYYILYKSYTIYNFFKKIIIASVDYKDLNDFFQDHSNTLDLGQPVFIFNREDGLLKDKLDALLFLEKYFLYSFVDNKMNRSYSLKLRLFIFYLHIRKGSLKRKCLRL